MAIVVKALKGAREDEVKVMRKLLGTDKKLLSDIDPKVESWIMTLLEEASQAIYSLKIHRDECGENGQEVLEDSLTYFRDLMKEISNNENELKSGYNKWKNIPDSLKEALVKGDIPPEIKGAMLRGEGKFEAIDLSKLSSSDKAELIKILMKLAGKK